MNPTNELIGHMTITAFESTRSTGYIHVMEVRDYMIATARKKETSLFNYYKDYVAPSLLRDPNQAYEVKYTPLEKARKKWTPPEPTVGSQDSLTNSLPTLPQKLQKKLSKLSEPSASSQIPTFQSNKGSTLRLVKRLL